RAHSLHRADAPRGCPHDRQAVGAYRHRPENSRRRGVAIVHHGRVIAMTMNWRRTLEIFDQHRTNEAVIVSPGMAGTLLNSIGHRQPALYNVGLSYASPYALGLALQRPDLRVVAIEGDGSLIA